MSESAHFRKMVSPGHSWLERQTGAEDIRVIPDTIRMAGPGGKPIQVRTAIPGTTCRSRREALESAAGRNEADDSDGPDLGLPPTHPGRPGRPINQPRKTPDLESSARA